MKSSLPSSPSSPSSSPLARTSPTSRVPGSTGSRLVKADTFAGLVRGDRVKALFEPDSILYKFRNVRYEFVSHVTNIENGSQWIDLWGGLPKHESWMSVRPNMVVKVDTRRKT